MAIAKCISANPVYNGSAVNLSASGISANTNRAHTVSDLTGTTFELVIDARYASGRDWSDPDQTQTVSDTNIPVSGNQDALIRYVGVTNQRHTIRGMSWGYNATPVGGSGVVSIESPSGTVLYSQYVTSSGPGTQLFEDGFRTPAGQDMLVFCRSGGASVKGSINVINHTIE